jgi:hypothetical protein
VREGSKAVVLQNGRTPICDGCKLKIAVLLGAVKAPERIRTTGKIKPDWQGAVE